MRLLMWVLRRLPSRPRRAYRTEPLPCPDRLHPLSRAPSLCRFFEEGYCANYQFVEAIYGMGFSFAGMGHSLPLVAHAEMCVSDLASRSSFALYHPLRVGLIRS